MAKSYRMKTSLGEVILSFDLDDFKVFTWEPCVQFEMSDKDMGSENRCEKFTIEKGQEYIIELYNGWISHILKTENNELFAIIELSDGYDGAPEYILEEILDESKQQHYKLSKEDYKWFMAEKHGIYDEEK